MTAEPAEATTLRGSEAPLLEVCDLVVEFHGREATVVANAHVSLALFHGETLGIVGESGSGKSVLCRSILRLIPSPPARVRGGEIWFEGQDLLASSEQHMQRVRGTRIKMVFQNPMTSLNPVWPIGDQITEGLRVHHGIGRSESREQGIELLRRVGIASPERRYDDYPHQWSGGMLQRAIIAMAMAGGSALLLADEPTTALDVTIQDQILALLLELQERDHMAMILVSHDLAVVAETCDRVAVMYAGQVMEVAPTAAMFAAPKHPYTLGLLSSTPRFSAQTTRLAPIAGQPPNLATLPPGCPFAPRCQFRSSACATTPVALAEVGTGHTSACLYPERLAGAVW